MNKYVLLIFLILNLNPSELYCDTDTDFQNLVKEYDYFESIELETKDGYILKVFRVRAFKERLGKPIILMHGIIDCSDSWVLNKNGSIGKTLLDQGYDLWFVNSRGNKYSCNHKTLDNFSKEFWDFSFQEMGDFDFRMIVEHVFFVRNEKIIVLGHSQGTSQVFAGLSKNFDLQDKILKFIAFAPIVYLIGLKEKESLFYYLSTHDYVKLLNLFHIYRLGEKKIVQNAFEKYALKLFCYTYKFLCDWFLEFVDGDPDVDDMSQMSNFLKHLPARSSSRSFEHYAQLIKNNDSKFRHFDFGEERNLKEYNSKIPPVYDITKIKIPLYIYYSNKDELSTIDNINLIKEQLPNTKFRYFENYGHLSYFWGKNVKKLNILVGDDVREEIKEIEI